MTQSEALNSPPLFTLPSGEEVFVWLTDQPVSVVAEARLGGAYVTLSLRNGQDGAELGDPAQSLVGGHRPGQWAKLHALAYATVSLFDDTCEGLSEGPQDDVLDFKRLTDRLETLRNAGGPLSIFG